MHRVLAYVLNFCSIRKLLFEKLVWESRSGPKSCSFLRKTIDACWFSVKSPFRAVPSVLRFANFLSSESITQISFPNLAECSESSSSEKVYLCYVHWPSDPMLDTYAKERTWPIANPKLPSYLLFLSDVMLLFKLCIFVLVIACYENVAFGGNILFCVIRTLPLTIRSSVDHAANDLLQLSKQAPGLVNAVLAEVRMFVKKVPVCECVSCKSLRSPKLLVQFMSELIRLFFPSADRKSKSPTIESKLECESLPRFLRIFVWKLD